MGVADRISRYGTFPANITDMCHRAQIVAQVGSPIKRKTEK